MVASKKNIDNWIETGKEKGATHIISVCDTFEYDDYPVYVMPGEDLEKIKSDYNGINMQKINEIIDLNLIIIVDPKEKIKKNILSKLKNISISVENNDYNYTELGKIKRILNNIIIKT